MHVSKIAAVRAIPVAVLAISTLLLNDCGKEFCDSHYGVCDGLVECQFLYHKDSNITSTRCTYPDGSQYNVDKYDSPIDPVDIQVDGVRPTILIKNGGARTSSATQVSSPSSTSVYVLDVIDLDEINPLSGKILRSLDLTANQPGSPVRFAITSDSKFAVVTNIYQNINSSNQAYVLIVDLASFTIAAKTAMLENTNAYGVAITPDDKFAYIVTQSDSTAQNSLYVLDLTTRQMATTIPLPSYQGLQNIAMTPDGTEAYLNSGVGTDLKVPVIDITTNTLSEEIFMDYYSPTSGNVLLSGPAFIAMHPDGTRVYLAPENGGPIFVVDTATNTIARLITIPAGAAPPAATRPVFSPNGRYLFIVDAPAAFSKIDTTSDTLAETIPFDSSIANAPSHSVKVAVVVMPAP